MEVLSKTITNVDIQDSGHTCSFKMFFLKSNMDAAFLLPSLNSSSASKFTCFVVCIRTLVISFSIYTLVHCKSIWSLHTGKFVDSFSIMHSQPFRIIRSSLNISLWIKLWINY